MGQKTVDWVMGGLNFLAGCLCISGAVVNFQMMVLDLRTAYIAVVLVLCGLVFTICEVFPCPAFFQRQISHLNTYQGRGIHYALLGLSAAQFPLVMQGKDLTYQKSWMWANAVLLILIGFHFGLVSIVNTFLSKEKRLSRPRSMDVIRDPRTNRRLSRATYRQQRQPSLEQRKQRPDSALTFLKGEDRFHRSSTIKSGINATVSKPLDGRMYSIDLSHMPTTQFSPLDGPRPTSAGNSSLLFQHRDLSQLPRSQSPSSSPKGSTTSTFLPYASSPWSASTKATNEGEYVAVITTPASSGFGSAGMLKSSGTVSSPLSLEAEMGNLKGSDGMFSAHQQQQLHSRSGSAVSFGKSLGAGNKVPSKGNSNGSPLAKSISVPQLSAAFQESPAASMPAHGHSNAAVREKNNEIIRSSKRPGSSGSTARTAYVKVTGTTDSPSWKPPQLPLGPTTGGDGFFRDLNADRSASIDMSEPSRDFDRSTLGLQQRPHSSANASPIKIAPSPSPEHQEVVTSKTLKKNRHSKHNIFIPSVGTIELSSDSDSGSEEDDNEDERDRHTKTGEKKEQLGEIDNEMIDDNASVYSIPSPVRETAGSTEHALGQNQGQARRPSNNLRSSLMFAASLTREEAVKVGRKLSRTETQKRRGKIQRAISIRQQQAQGNMQTASPPPLYYL